MSIDEFLENRIREIVREELQNIVGDSAKRFEPWELAQRWNTTADAVSRLARSGQLKAIRISERKMIFAMEEVVRFERSGGIDQLDIAA